MDDAIQARTILEVAYKGTLVRASCEAKKFFTLLEKTFSNTDVEYDAVRVFDRDGYVVTFARSVYTIEAVSRRFADESYFQQRPGRRESFGMRRLGS